MENFFKRDITSLDGVFSFLESWIGLHGIDGSHGFTIKLAVEEIFTNMVKYNPHGSGDIRISLELESHTMVVRMTDVESVPFDPTKRGEVDVTLPLHQRKPGGLGIHLVKTMVDKVEFAHEGNTSTITLTLNLER